MNHPKAIVCESVPQIGIPESPALFTDASDLFIAYESTSIGDFAIIKFINVIDHRLSPINDEGLGQHPCAKFGLEFYSFHEILDSPDAHHWRALKTRHFVITFKDNTLDVLTNSFVVEGVFQGSNSPSGALLEFLESKNHRRMD